MNFRRDSQLQAPGFQMAPMIDVVFLLLIFFMVASIFAQWESKVDIQVPVAETAEPMRRKLSEIMVNLDQSGAIFVNSYEMSKDDLLRTLQTVSRDNPNTPIIIRADGRTDHKFVMGVLDVCRKAQIINISFATVEQEQTDDGGGTP